MSAGAKNAQAHYDAMTKQAAEIFGPPSDFLAVSRAVMGLDPFGKPMAGASSGPPQALFVDTKV